MGMLWRQRLPSTSYPGTSLHPLPAQAFDHTFSFNLPQTVDPGSRPPPSHLLQPHLCRHHSAPSLCAGPLSAASAPLPQSPPQLFLSLNSLPQPGKESEHTHVAIYTQEHLTFPLPWPHSTRHRPAVSLLRQEAGWTEPCLLPTPPL